MEAYGNNLDNKIAAQLNKAFAESNDESESGAREYDSDFEQLPVPDSNTNNHRSVLDLESGVSGKSYEHDEADYDIDDHGELNLDDLDEEEPVGDKGKSPLALAYKHFQEDSNRRFDQFLAKGTADHYTGEDTTIGDARFEEKERKAVLGDEDSQDVILSDLEEEEEQKEQKKRQQKEERKEKEQKEKEQKEKEQKEKEQKEKEQKEKERKEKEQKEKERKEREQKEKERKEREQREKERKEREQKEREQREKERKEREQKEREQREKEREQKEREQKEREQKEKERKEREQKEKERKEREQKEKERKEREQKEKERKEKEQKEKEQKEKEQKEKERKEKEQKEKERKEREQKEKEQKEREQKEKEQKESEQKEREIKQKKEEEQKRKEEVEAKQRKERRRKRHAENRVATSTSIDREKEITAIATQIEDELKSRLPENDQYRVKYFVQAAYNMAIDVHTNTGSTSRSRAVRENVDNILKSVNDPEKAIDPLIRHIEKQQHQNLSNASVSRLILAQSVLGPVRYSKELKSVKKCRCIVTGETIGVGDSVIYAVVSIGKGRDKIRLLPMIPKVTRRGDRYEKESQEVDSDAYEPPSDSSSVSPSSDDDDASDMSIDEKQDSSLGERKRSSGGSANTRTRNADFIPDEDMIDDDAESEVDDEDLIDSDNSDESDDEDDMSEESNEDILLFTVKKPAELLQLIGGSNYSPNSKNYSLMQPKESTQTLPFFTERGVVDMNSDWAVPIAKAVFEELFQVKQTTRMQYEEMEQDETDANGSVIAETDYVAVVLPQTTEDVCDKISNYTFLADDMSSIYSARAQVTEQHRKFAKTMLSHIKGQKHYLDKANHSFVKSLFAKSEFSNIKNSKSVASARFVQRFINSIISDSM